MDIELIFLAKKYENTWIGQLKIFIQYFPNFIASYYESMITEKERDRDWERGSEGEWDSDRESEWERESEKYNQIYRVLRSNWPHFKN